MTENLTNIIISTDGGCWEKSPVSFDRRRIFEYTDDALANRFKSDNLIKEDIFSIPTVFGYERGYDTGHGVKVGKITNIEYESSTYLKIHFEHDNRIPHISSNQFDEIQFDLKIDDWEFSRTHWAIKDVDLYSILDVKNLMPKNINEKPTVNFIKNSVFICYAHADKEYLARLKVHLSPISDFVDFEITVWEDTKLEIGEDWKLSIEENLNKCTVAILLISADFLASKFITETELPTILKGHEQRGVRIIPVIVKHCIFDHHPILPRFQAINDPKEPLASLDENKREYVYTQIAQTILVAANKSNPEV